MPIRFACPSCHKTFTVKDQLAGRRAHCAACKAPLTVPHPPVQAALETLPEPALPPLEDLSEPLPGPPCPGCRRILPHGAVLCTHCGHDLRKGKSVRTVIAPAFPGARKPSAVPAFLRSPFTYIALGAAVLVLVLLLSPSASALTGIALICLGLFVAIIGNIFFGWQMFKAVYQDYGIFPFFGLFVPIIGFFVNLWMIISYWEHAKKALASVIAGILLIIVGGFVTSRMGGPAAFKNLLAVTPKPSAPVFPALPEPSHPQPGIDQYDIRISGTGPGTNMRVLLYMPSAAERPDHSLPCILIAPAGTSMLTGVRLSAEDQKEHLPYVRRGFAVAAFDLDGSVPPSASNADFIAAVRAFRDARHGLTNAANTVDFLLAKVPAIDPDHLFAVGHSSAGGFALNLAAADHRIKAVVAYAPSTDILQEQPAQLISALGRSIYDIRTFAAEASPISHVTEIDCPVYLFNAADDTTVAPSGVAAFANALRSAGKTVEQRTVPFGGHYNAMIHEGILQGIAWLSKLAPAAAPPAVANDPEPEPTRITAAPEAAPRPSPQTPPARETSATPPHAPAFPERSSLPARTPGERPPGMPPADRRTTPETGNQDPIPYIIPAPEGFERIELTNHAIHEFRRTLPAHSPSTYTVVVRKTNPNIPEPRLTSNITLDAKGITFRQLSSFNSPSLQTVIYIARDGDYTLTIRAARDPQDQSATAAMTAAAKGIRHASPFPATAP